MTIKVDFLWKFNRSSIESYSILILVNGMAIRHCYSTQLKQSNDRIRYQHHFDTSKHGERNNKQMQAWKQHKIKVKTKKKGKLIHRNIKQPSLREILRKKERKKEEKERKNKAAKWRDCKKKKKNRCLRSNKKNRRQILRARALVVHAEVLTWTWRIRNSFNIWKKNEKEKEREMRNEK